MREASPEHGRKRPRNPRSKGHVSPKADDRYVNSIKVEAPTFDGKLEPQVYLDWKKDMDRYFQ